MKKKDTEFSPVFSENDHNYITVQTFIGFYQTNVCNEFYVQTLTLMGENAKKKAHCLNKNKEIFDYTFKSLEMDARLFRVNFFLTYLIDIHLLKC